VRTPYGKGVVLLKREDGMYKVILDTNVTCFIISNIFRFFRCSYFGELQDILDAGRSMILYLQALFRISIRVRLVKCCRTSSNGLPILMTGLSNFLAPIFNQAHGLHSDVLRSRLLQTRPMHFCTLSWAELWN
jgi:hypothetical protein